MSIELMVLAGALLVPVVMFFGVRWWEGRQPLRLGDTLVVQEVGPQRVLRLRACLGAGRRVDRWDIDAAWQQPGDAVRLSRTDPPGRLVGPWTITLRPAGALPAGGRLTVTVTAWEGEASWTTSQTYALESAVYGTFEPLIDVVRGKVTFARRWSEARPATDA